jgi:multiple sugar transport system ATP-binding protein
MNLFTTDVVDGGVKFGQSTVPVEREALANTGQQVTIGVRPEDIQVSTSAVEGLEVVVDLVEELGADGYLYGHSDIKGKRTDIVARVDGRIHPSAGETVHLTATPHHVHLFDLESGERLGTKAVASA